MKREDLAPGQRWAILGGAAMMLTLAMGMRQSLGLFQPHLIRDLGITAADFSLAIALQNLVWGLTQPFVGALVDRVGARPVAVAGVLAYGAGLAMSVTSRTVSPLKRSVAMGTVSAVGSLGLMVASPLAQTLIVSGGWQLAMVAFLALVAVMLPAAFMAGGVDRIEPEAHHGAAQSVGDAVREAAGHPGYLVMAGAYFVCGLQLVFLTTHLPAYLDLCGIAPGVTASALALIGLFNAFGSWVFGWLGGRYSKRVLLGTIYVLRSLVLTAFFSSTPTPTTTLLFGAAMGSLWLGVVPLVNGLVIHLFGLRYIATLSGIAFFSHQLGSFVGAWGGGMIYSALGSYEWAWKSAVLVGLVAGAVQMTMNVRPAARVRAERADSAASA
jgi:predicted MFS family arabinose efflux permease